MNLLLGNNDAAIEAARREREEYEQQVREEEELRRQEEILARRKREENRMKEEEAAENNQQNTPAVPTHFGKSFLKEFAVLMKKGRKRKYESDDSSDDEEEAINISKDMFARYGRANGAVRFSVEKFAAHTLPLEYGSILMEIGNKMMALDTSLKRGEALKANKINVFMYGMPRILLDQLVQDRIRRNLEIGGSIRDAILDYFHITKLLNAFCLRYHNEIQANCVQKLGQRIGSKKRYDGILVKDVEAAICDATFNKLKLRGFEKELKKKVFNNGDSSRPAKKARKNNNNGNSNGINRNNNGSFDLSLYRNKNSNLFTPPGWCIWKFRKGGCKRGVTCQFKHTMWTPEDLAAAKAAI